MRTAERLQPPLQLVNTLALIKDVCFIALSRIQDFRREVSANLRRKLLEQFVSFCEQASASRVTSELALAWVSAPAKASAGWLGMRLTVVRGFASWLQASDPATEVPPLGWLPPRRRTTPYLYSADDVPRCWRRRGRCAGRSRRPPTRRSLPCWR